MNTRDKRIQREAMFRQLLLLFTVTVLVNGCTKTAYKRHGESCQCSDTCLDNAECQRDGKGGFACFCLPCQYYDPTMRQCVDIPGYGDQCTTVCTTPYVCTNETDGSRTCQPCPSTQYFDEETMACVNLPTFGEACKDVCACNLICQVDPNKGASFCTCTADSTGWDPTKGVCKYECFTNNSNSCRCFPNGDYQACFPQCQDGVYISCYNGTLYTRDCGVAWYVRPDKTRFTEKMVYVQTLGRCERLASYCPRPLDLQVEG